MIVQKLSRSDHVPVHIISQPPPDTTPSESSGGSSDESEEGDDWDSGENANLPLVRHQ